MQRNIVRSPSALTQCRRRFHAKKRCSTARSVLRSRAGKDLSLFLHNAWACEAGSCIVQEELTTNNFIFGYAADAEVSITPLCSLLTLLLCVKPPATLSQGRRWPHYGFAFFAYFAPLRETSHDIESRQKVSALLLLLTSIRVRCG